MSKVETVENQHVVEQEEKKSSEKVVVPKKSTKKAPVKVEPKKAEPKKAPVKKVETKKAETKTKKAESETKKAPVKKVETEKPVVEQPEKAVKKSKKNNLGFFSYIPKVLKLVHPDSQITRDAAIQIDDFLHIMIGRIADIAHGAAQNRTKNGKRTVTSVEVEYAVKEIFTGEIAKHAVSEGQKACEKYNADTTVKESTKLKKKSETAQHRAGITFSVSRCHKLLRKFGGKESRVGDKAAVYTAACLEYITAEILELAGNIARDCKVVKVIIRHIHLAIQFDEELRNLFEKYKIEFAGSGVVPNIPEELLVKNKKKKAIKPKGGEKGGHKYHPGTVALRNIKKAQKGSDLMMQKQTFNNNFKRIVNTFAEGIRFSSKDNVLATFQSFVETRIIKLFQDAQQRAIDGNRQGISQRDMQRAADALPISLMGRTKTADVKLASAGLRHLSKRAGAMRVSEDVVTDLNNEIVPKIMTSLAYSLVNIIEYRKAKTASGDMTKAAIRCTGYNFIGNPPKH